MKIGILAVQGDYEAHARMLERLGAEYLLVRTPEDAAQVDAMILPGGESTTMLKFLKEEGLEAALRALDARGAPFFGTCAGAILLAREVRAPAQESLGFADLAITRNAYGRQLASEVRSAPSKLKPEPLEMVFIRAPWIDEIGPGVEVLAREGGRPVLVRDGRLLIATFHPELSDDTTVHEYFLKLAEAESSCSDSKSGRADPESRRAGSESSFKAGCAPTNSSASKSASWPSTTADPSPMRRR